VIPHTAGATRAARLSALFAATRDVRVALLELEAREATLFEIIENMGRAEIDDLAREIAAERDPLTDELVAELLPADRRIRA
jgi:hypothetical protein